MCLASTSARKHPPPRNATARWTGWFLWHVSASLCLSRPVAGAGDPYMEASGGKGWRCAEAQQQGLTLTKAYLATASVV